MPEARAAALIVGTTVASEDGPQQRLLPSLVGGGAAVLFIFLAGTWFLAGRALAPIALAFRRQQGFVTTQAHESRTSLGSIKGYCTALLSYGPRLRAADHRQFLETIIHATDRLASQMDDILLSQRLEARTLPIHAESLDLDALAKQVVAELRGRWPEHHIDYCAPHSLPPVCADEHRLRQVLLNLLDNAAKSSPAGSQVRMAAAVGSKEVVVSVHDEGESIPPGQLERVFEPFHQLDSTHQAARRGTGLSLVISKGIVAAHGGRIWVESAGRGRGSTFHFTLPIADRAEFAAPRQPDGTGR